MREILVKNRGVLVKGAVFLVLYVITLGMIAATALIRPEAYEGFAPLRVFILIFATILLTKYLFYMIVSPWHEVWVAWTQRHWKKVRPVYNPLVSVLVPAWNEEVGIISTMRSLLNGTYDNLELVVVNDGSQDRSDEIIRTFKKEYEARPVSERGRRRISYEYQQNGGKGRALNTAISLASGEILISVDADCIVTDTAIANFVEHFRNPKVMAAVGNVRIGNTKTLIGLIQYLEFLFSFYFKKADSLMNTIYIIGGAAGAFRREIFDNLGHYNTKNITEDIELSMRIQDGGMRIVYADDAVVYTEGASELRGLVKQRLRWKRGRFETFRDYGHMFFSVRSHHNKLLTMLLLPLALFAEVQLFFEFWFLMYLYFLSFITSDYSSFLSGIIVVSSMFIVQMLFDEKKTRTLSFIFLAPIAWLLFYVMTYVETSALLQSVWGFFRKKEVVWQRWQRVGIQGS